MKRYRSFKRAVPGLAAAAALGVLGLPAAYSAEGDAPGKGDFNFALSGYARAWVSVNMQNQPELRAHDEPFAKVTNGYKSKWKPSMVRGSVLMDADASYMGLKFKAIARLDREYKTNYLEKLEDLRKTNASAAVGTGSGPLSLGTPNNSIMDNYNNFDFREFWVEAPIGDRTTVKFGRQQLVWGESDFFHAMDLVHGYDLSWRLFFEGENEEWRKPLILLSTKIRIPEANGLLAAYIRPGWDRCSDIGNTYDIGGGRWFFQPYRGFDLNSVTDKDCKHKDWDENDVTYGVRWQGEAFNLNYSFAYLTTFSADPVANPNSAFSPGKQFKGVQPSGAVFDRIHPKIDVFGATVSGYSETLDAVLSAEVAYTKDQPYNVGTGSFFGGETNPLNTGVGLDGIKLKDTLTTMIRIDKNLKFEDILGTTRPSFSSIQLFDTMVLSYNGKQEDLVRLFAYGTELKKHSTILTAFTVLNYRNDEINPGFAVGFDLTNGGGFAIPSVAFTLDDKWVGKVEADLFWDGGRSNKTQFSNEKSQLFGYFAKSNQLVFRLTRQF